MRSAPALALLLLLATAAGAADSITLANGSVIEGRIVEEEETRIRVEMPHGPVWLPRSQIRSISREPAPDAEKGTPPGPAPDARGETRGSSSGARAGGTDADAGQRRTPSRPVRGAASGKDAPSAEEEFLRENLASEDLAQRRKAGEWIAETWPQWRSTVEFVLAGEKNETVRLETVRLLDRPEIDDVVQLVDVALGDTSASVRLAALRVARHRKLAGLEQRVIALMRADATWAVRQEAIRTLEDIGGADCLSHVMAAWSGEHDKDRKRRYRRVMAALLGEDFHDDATAWWQAADELFMGQRELRKGKVARADEHEER